MTSRLTVVVSQGANRNALSADQEETLVAELMMTQGLDATMIGPLEHIAADDTDHLCLSSFNHSFVVVSALETEELRRHWQRLDLAGEVVAVDRRDPTARSGAKRIYHVPLDRGGEVADLMKQILQIQQDRSVKTIAIGLGSLAPSSTVHRPAPTEETSAAAPRVASQSTRQDSQTHSEGTVSQAVKGAQPNHTQPPAKPAASQLYRPEAELEQDEGDWDHLDQLVDDLDALDL